MDRLRSTLSTLPDGIMSRPFPQRSPPWLLTTAACGGLRSAPDCRTRRVLLHLSYSCASPFGPALLVTQDPERSFGFGVGGNGELSSVKSGRPGTESPDPQRTNGLEPQPDVLPPAHSRDRSQPTANQKNLTRHRRKTLPDHIDSGTEEIGKADNLSTSIKDTAANNP